MPDLNFENPAVRAEIIRVARLWLDRGVDGFRLDAARHIVAAGPGELQNDTPATHAFWRDFSAALRASYPDVLLVGENWTSSPIIATYYGDTTKVAGGDELPMSFNFPLAGAVLEAVRTRAAAPVIDALAEMQSDYPTGVLDAPFLTNHDMVRVATVLGGDQVKLRTAAAILLTMPGAPFLYYGEELGLSNGPTGEGDPAKRTPMPWSGAPAGGFTSGTPWHALAPGWEKVNVAAESGDGASLLSHYRALIRLRHCNAALRVGDIEILTAPAGVLAYLRVLGDERVLVVHNLGESAVVAKLSVAAASADCLYVSSLLSSLSKGTAGWAATLVGGASGVWRLHGQ
jgi:glycosidase